MKRIALFLVVVSLPLLPCTGIFLATTQNTYIHARTLEFGQDLHSEILFVPRNYRYTTLAPSGKNEGLTWKTKYAAIGINAFASPNFIDGVNEKGLAGGLFYFPGFAEYQNVTHDSYGRSIPMFSLLTWILTNFATIDEVKKALPTIFVSKTPFPDLNEIIPAHLIIHDTKGQSLVVEYIAGILHMHDNPLGVITNSPSFDWHMTNLSNYVNLFKTNVHDKTIKGITISPLGQGSGMLGLPGDFTPPSRFVRATVFSASSPKSTTELAAVYQAFHILNNFDIPQGIILDDKGTSDYTYWTSATDMHNKIVYVRPHENFQLQKVELAKMNLNSLNPQTFSMQRTEQILEIPSSNT